jgi:hypothetical protein
MLTAQKLRQKLGLSAKRLARLIKQGLPCKGKGSKRTFNPADVATWLRERGLARSTAAAVAEQIVATIPEAALLLEVAPRTLAQWLTDPTFPGKAGTPGRRDGYFPISQIRQWHLATHGATARGSQTDAEAATAKRLKAQIECDRAQVELEKELLTIGDVEQWEALARRVIAAAKGQLDELPDRVAARLPGKLAPEIKQTIRRVIAQSTADALNTLAELVAGDTDETEDTPDDADNANTPDAGS